MDSSGAAPAPGGPPRASPGRLLASLFLINAPSLLLQMVWVRKLMTVFGSTALTVSTVLSVFTDP